MATTLPPNTHIGGWSSKVWIYPDGSTSSVEPSDTQMFFIWDANKAYPKACYQYDKKNQIWLDVTANFERMIELGKQSKKCECGSESVGSSRHSSWCPKWSADP